MGKQQRTMPASRYTAPAGALIAPQYMLLVDPLEVAEPEYSLRSVPSLELFTQRAALDRPNLRPADTVTLICL